MLKNEEPIIFGLRRAMLNNWNEKNINYIEEMGMLQRAREDEMEKREMHEERKVRKLVYKVERES